MDLNKKNINVYQLAVCIAAPFLGIRTLSLTREISIKFNQDAWLAIGLGCIVATLLSYTAYKSTQLFPDKTIIQINEVILGKYMGKLISLIMVVTILGISALNARLFVDVIKAFLLPLTPVEMLLIVMLVTTTYLIPFGLPTIIRIFEIFVPIIVLFYLGLILFTIGIADFENLLPILHSDIKDVLLTVPYIMPPFLSVGIIHFIMPQVKESNKAYPYILGAMLFATVITVLINIFAIAVLGDSLKQYMYPFVVLTYAVEFQQTFLERIDLFFMVMWCLAAFNMLTLMKYWASNAICQVTGLRSPLLVMLLIAPILYIISISPENIMDLTESLRLLTPIVVFTVVGLPLIITLVALARGIKEVKNDSETNTEKN